MATFAAMLGLRIKGIQVENVATTAKTLPNFVDLWNDMLVLTDVCKRDVVKETVRSV